MVGQPYIPETITVHLGTPDSNAANVTVSFPDYVKNVASGEIFPTWPESALRANMYAQISYALNRVYTEWYRSRGYDFDITASTAFDQSFVKNREVFENISQIADEIFNDYIRRSGYIEPLFASFCDGVRVQCGGLSQWGSVDLANMGYVPYDILTHYYGDDIELVFDAPIRNIDETYPGVPLRLGSGGGDVRVLQVRLNRVSRDYPLIPKISLTDGVFGEGTEDAVRGFQRIFNLKEDGIVGKATWYKLQYIYAAVARLAELNSEGVRLEDIPGQFEYSLSLGSRGNSVRAVQYYLAVVALYNNAVPPLEIDGVFGGATQSAVSAFQQFYGESVTGIVDFDTWNTLTEAFRGIVASNPGLIDEGDYFPYPGEPLSEGSRGEAVRGLQSRLAYISEFFDNIPYVEVTGYFGEATKRAVNAFLEDSGLNPQGFVGPGAWSLIEETYISLAEGDMKAPGQYPGYVLGEEVRQ